MYIESKRKVKGCQGGNLTKRECGEEAVEGFPHIVFALKPLVNIVFTDTRTLE